MAEASFNQKAVNLWVSRIIPLVLVGIVGYVTWVVILRLCGQRQCFSIILGSLTEAVDYLLNPPANLPTARQGVAIAILVLFATLLLLMGLTYFRLLYTVTTNPGYVPQGPQLLAKQAKVANTRKGHKTRVVNKESPTAREKAGIDGVSLGASEKPAASAYTHEAFYAPVTKRSAPGLQDFYSKGLFVCQGDGRPIWCSTCENWKPDRAHHCREVGRCVRKMDHFCPW